MKVMNLTFSRNVLTSVVLMVSLLVLSMVLNRGVTHALDSNSDVALAASSSQYLLGETIVFTGALSVDADQEVTISGITLANTTGPQAFTVTLPGEETGGTFVDYSSSSISGDLLVKVTYDNVSGSAGDGTLPSTLAGTLPGSLSEEVTVTGGSGGGTIDYVVQWTPDVLLDPIPDLTLIPNTDTYFTIPTLAPPSDAVGTKMPSTDAAWSTNSGAVPTAGEVAGTALPSSDSAVAVPTIELSTNAPDAVDALPASTAYMGTGATSSLGFAIPTLSAATSTAASFPEGTDSFAIPAPTVATSSITSFGSGADEQFVVPATDGTTSTAQVVKGMAHDGDDFWFIVAGVSNDSLLKVSGSDYTLSSSTTLPSTGFDGVAAVGSSIFVLENQNRCWDEIETDNCQYQSRIFKIASSGDLPSNGNDSSWTAGSSNKVTALIHAGQDWDQFAGLTVGGSGDLWTVDEFGNRFRNISASGIELDDNEGEWTQAKAIAFASNLIYTADGSDVTQWTDAGSKIQTVDVGKSAIKSLTFDGDTMYFTSNADGKVYATFVGASVDSPVSSKGIAFSTVASTESLWMLVDGSPKDYILKVDPSDGSLVTNFSDDGWAQAPSADTEGIEYFDGYLYIIANEGSGCCDQSRQLYKVNATTGAVESNYPKNLTDTASVWDDLGDITNDGTNLVVWTKTNFNDVYKISTTGEQVSQNWVNGPSWQGSKGIAYHPVQKTYYAVNGTELSKLDTTFNQTGTANLAAASGGTAMSDIQGMTFSDSSPYNDLWLVSGTRVYHSFISASVTTQPRGIAWSSSDATGLGGNESVWVLVDAEPFDQILRVNTADGSLNTSFDSDGIADAPSGGTEGLAFVSEGNDNFLYIIANDESGDAWNKRKNLYKYNVKTNVVASTTDLESSAQIWDDVGGITYDGENLIISAKTNSNVWKVNPSNGERVAEGWPCCSMTFGLKALAYHEARTTLYGASGSSLMALSSDLNSFESDQTITLGGSTMSGNVHGMTFGQDVLYIARTQSNAGYITASAFASSITTKPQGMAISPSSAFYQGTNVGAALWVLVDGAPKDRVIKVSISGYSPDTNFGSDDTKNGSAELPSSTITGITFLDNALWAIGTSGYDNKLWKLNPVTGAELNAYNLCGGMHGPHMGGGGGGGMQMCDTPGGLANNGTQLIASSSQMERFWYINTDGNVDRESMDQYALGGADAVDFIQGDNTYWTAKEGDVQLWINPFGQEIWPAKAYTLTGGVQNVQGMAIHPDTSVIYMGWNDGTDGYISTAVPPSPITNTPVDLAYNFDDGELYILVDGNGGDAVVAVNPSTGAIITADGEEKYYVINSEEGSAVAYHDGRVYIVAEERGFMGPPPQEVTVLNASDFSLADNSGFQIGTDMGGVPGLTSNGDDLVATSQHGGPRIDNYNQNNGNRTNELYLFNPGQPGWMEEGFSDIAYSTSTPQYFLSKYGTIYRSDEDGQIIDNWDIQDPGSNALGDISGIDFVGNNLYVADATTKKVYKALVPLPTITITNTPRAMALDGNTMWVAVDASPVDKILKMSVSTTTATVIASFDSPNSETYGLAIQDGILWVLDNGNQSIEMPGGGVMQMQIPVLYQLDKDSGTVNSRNPLVIRWDDHMPAEIFTGLLGGLASDGTNLWAGSDGDPDRGMEGFLYRINPYNYDMVEIFGKMIAGAVVEEVNQFEGSLTRLNAINSVDIAPDSDFDNDRRLIIAGASNYGNLNDRITRLDLTNGFDSVATDQYQITGADIVGTAISGTTMFLLDAATNSVLGTSLPENTGVEMTIVGNYTTAFSADQGGSTYTSSASYAVARNTNVAIQLTSPTQNFVATTPNTTIAGKVSDPAVTSVSVGIQLPFTEFLNDDVDDASASNALWTGAVSHGDGSVSWHIDDTGSCPDCGDSAWRFGKAGDTSFNQEGSRVAGTLTSKEVYPIAMGSQLGFSVAWDTEFPPDMDRKFIQVASVTSDLQGNDVVGQFQTIGQIVQFVDPFWMPFPDNEHPDLFQWVEAPPLPFAPGEQHDVGIDLSPLAGKRVKVRFAFDSNDEWANEGAGLYIDNITLSGSGTKTITVPTTALATPVVANVNGTSTTLYREFSYPFPLAEGENTVVATAVQSYSPNLSGSAQAQGFVDTIAPVITLSNVPSNTNQVIQTLQGTLKEPTINAPGALMEITHNLTTPAGATSSVVIGKVTSEGAFSFGVSLQEGTNTFVARATDGGGLSASTTLTSIADLTAPTASVAVVTVTSAGEAVVGDQYFIVVSATDPLSGVESATLEIEGTNGIPLDTVGDTPDILLEMHGLSEVDGKVTSHVGLATVSEGTPVGLNSISVSVRDMAGNEAPVEGSFDVVSARTNRNYFLFPGNNFMGLALIPDDDDASTTDDASLDRLMSQDVTSQVSEALGTKLSGTVELGDVIESTSAYNKAGNFIVHTPGDGAADTLTELKPFQGMIINAKTAYVADDSSSTEVFKQVSVAGFTAKQSVPIKFNIQGVFFRQGEVPPEQELRVGYNLVAPHILIDTSFDSVFRGALIPYELAVSALTFERRVDASITDDINASIFETFQSKSLGGILSPVRSYWTFIVDDPNNVLVNSLGDQLGPTITP